MADPTVLSSTRATEYWAHGDSVLTDDALLRGRHNRQSLVESLNLHALFADSFAMPDVPTLRNLVLGDVLMAGDRKVLLEEGVVTPMRRSSAASYEALNAEIHDEGTYYQQGHRKEMERFARFLDRHTQEVVSTPSKAAQLLLRSQYSQWVNVLAEHDVLRSDADWGPVAKRLQDYYFWFLKEHGKHKVGRRIFYGFTRDKLNPLERDKFEYAIGSRATAIYHEALVESLNLVGSWPAELVPDVTSGGLANINSDSAAFEVEGIASKYVLNLGVVARLSGEGIMSLRRTREGKAYFRFVRTCGFSRHGLEEALVRYCERIAADGPSSALLTTDMATKRARRDVQLVRIFAATGSAGIALTAGTAAYLSNTSVVFPAMSLVWLFGGLAAANRLAAAVEKARLAAKADDARELTRTESGGEEVDAAERESRVSKGVPSELE